MKVVINPINNGPKYINIPFLIESKISTKAAKLIAGIPSKNEYLAEYFDTFEADLSKKNLNFYLKGVRNP